MPVSQLSCARILTHLIKLLIFFNWAPKNVAQATNFLF